MRIDTRQLAPAAPARLAQQAPAPTPAGWYPDPHGQPVQRWWDGMQWTGDVAP
jgi:hypothetical protein